MPLTVTPASWAGVSHEREAVESSQERAPDLDRPVCRRRTAPQWPASRGGGEATDPMPRAPKNSKKLMKLFFRSNRNLGTYGEGKKVS